MNACFIFDHRKEASILFNFSWLLPDYPKCTNDKLFI